MRRTTRSHGPTIDSLDVEVSALKVKVGRKRQYLGTPNGTLPPSQEEVPASLPPSQDPFASAEAQVGGWSGTRPPRR
jgi:hypothetical protein